LALVAATATVIDVVVVVVVVLVAMFGSCLLAEYYSHYIHPEEIQLLIRLHMEITIHAE